MESFFGITTSHPSAPRAIAGSPLTASASMRNPGRSIWLGDCAKADMLHMMTATTHKSEIVRFESFISITSNLIS